MDAALIPLVWQRAHDCCEYCYTPQVCSLLTFEIDHVIARKIAVLSINLPLRVAQRQALIAEGVFPP